MFHQNPSLPTQRKHTTSQTINPSSSLPRDWNEPMHVGTQVRPAAAE